MANAVFVKLTAQEGKRDELVAALMPLVEAAKSEEGTVAYALHEAADEADVVWFYELYADDEAQKAHSTSATMREVGPKLAALLGAPPMITRATPKAGKGLSVF